MTTSFSEEGLILVKQKADEIWEKVTKIGNRVLFQCNFYGYHGVEVIPDPNLHVLIDGLSFIDGALDLLNSHATFFNLDYDEIRKLLNAKTQVVILERIAAALKAKNEEDYKQAVDDLSTSAAF